MRNNSRRLRHVESFISFATFLLESLPFRWLWTNNLAGRTKRHVTTCWHNFSSHDQNLQRLFNSAKKFGIIFNKDKLAIAANKVWGKEMFKGQFLKDFRSKEIHDVIYWPGRQNAHADTFQENTLCPQWPMKTSKYYIIMSVLQRLLQNVPFCARTSAKL